jgi:hypothetical protein
MKIAGVPAETQTKHLPCISLQGHRYTNLLGGCMYCKAERSRILVNMAVCPLNLLSTREKMAVTAPPVRPMGRRQK